MKKLLIKYNPYKITTELTIEGIQLADNSLLAERTADGKRLQEWIEDFPRQLVDELNDDSFDITFHGTLMDYEDVTESFGVAYEKGILKEATLDWKPAKETTDKEVLIEKVFNEILEGPFDELRSADVRDAFEKEKSNDFDVCVVATISAGKSTLINALLGCKLMPSKQEACTAIITRIKDTDSAQWSAEVYDKDYRKLETHSDLTYDMMSRLNDDPRVSEIHVEGDIPFVTAEDVSLVLIDTPGPNNARNREHGRVQSTFLDNSSKSLILYIMESTFGNNDDYNLLERVAESMSVGGKQSKDRFLFVVNKMDTRGDDDGDTGQALERVRAYLKIHGIDNPNLFPIAALPALNIRLMQNGTKLDEDTIDETEAKIKKFNRESNASRMRLEEYATLPPSVREDIKKRLEEAKTKENDAETALIHTGIPSVESAIRQYVQKYAKTAKIKNIVDTFIHRLSEAGCFEETKKELAENINEYEKIAAQIQALEAKIDNAEEAKGFKNAVDDAVSKVNDQCRDVAEDIVEKFQKKITEKINSCKGRELSVNEAENESDELKKFAKQLEPDFQQKLDKLCRGNLEQTGSALLNEYKSKLESLSAEIDFDSMNGIKIDPLSLMSGSVSSVKFSVQNHLQKKEVEDGEEWIANTKKKWYKPWTWFQEKGYWRTKYKSVEYVDAGEVAKEILAPIQDRIYQNKDDAIEYANRQSMRIAGYYKEEFTRLDNLLKKKLAEMEECVSDKNHAEEMIKETQKKLKWLNEIKSKVESILEI